jgi:hypothetical protein
MAHHAMPQLDWNLHHHASLQVHLNLHYHASPQVHSDLQFHVSRQVHPWNLRQSRCPGCMAQHKCAAHDNLLHHGEHPHDDFGQDVQQKHLHNYLYVHGPFHEKGLDFPCWKRTVAAAPLKRHCKNVVLRSLSEWQQ